MADLVAFTVLGLALGGAYAIAAAGMVLTFTTTGIFNFAHGAVAMLAAFVYWQLRWSDGWGGQMPAPVALVLVVVVLAPAAGAVVDRTLMRRLRSAPEIAQIAVPVALLLALTGAASWIWASTEARDPQPFFGATTAVQVGKAGIEVHRLVIVGAAVAAAAGLRLLLVRTGLGVRMRAVVNNPELAELHGIRPDAVSTAAWSLGFATAALSGILLSPLLGSLTSLLLTLLVINAYAAAAFGRLRSLPWTFAGAVAVGLAVNYWAWLKAEFGNDWTWLSNFRSAIPIVLLFAVLVALPRPAASRSAGSAADGAGAGGVGLSGRASMGWGLALVAAVGLASRLLAPSWQLALGEALALSVVALSVVLLTGLAGEISLAPLTFAGIGAMVAFQIDVGPSGRPSVLHGSLWSYLAAAAVCAVVGAVVALPALRLRGLYLALATFAFAAATSSMVFKQIRTLHFDVPLVGDGSDIEVDLFSNGVLRVPRPEVPGVSLERAAGGGQELWLVFVACAFAVLGAAVAALRRSSYGVRLAALRDSPAAAAMVGMNIMWMKVSVFALSSALAGVGGVLLAASSTGGVVEDDFSVFASLALVLMVAVMGATRVSGALMGGLAIGAGLPMVRSILATAAEHAAAFAGVLDLAADAVVYLGPALAGLSLAFKPQGVSAGALEALRGRANRQPSPPSSGGAAARSARAPSAVAAQTATPGPPAGIDRRLSVSDRRRLDEQLGIAGRQWSSDRSGIAEGAAAAGPGRGCGKQREGERCGPAGGGVEPCR